MNPRERFASTSGLPCDEYEASRMANGKWMIHDVPIMGPLEEGEKNAPEDIGRDWMERAISFGKLRAGEGHFGSLHVYHHPEVDTGNSNVQPAGQIVPKRIGTATYEGEVVPVVLADLVNVPNVVFAKMKAGELPYRSPEVYDWEKPEINSLALLPTETPFFRLNMLTNFKEVPPKEGESLEAIRLSATSRPAVAVTTGGSGGRILFRFKEGSMTPDEKKDEPEEMAEGTPPCEDKSEEPEKMMEEAMPPWAEQLMQMVAQIAESLAPTEEPMTDDNKVVEPAAMRAAELDVAKMSAEVLSLKQRVDARDKTDADAALAQGAITELEEGGWNVDNETNEAIHKFAAKDKEVLDTFVERFKAKTPQDPPTTLEAFTSQMGGEDAPEVAEFNDTPERLAAARECSSAYSRALARGARLQSERADYIRSNIGRFMAGGD